MVLCKATKSGKVSCKLGRTLQSDLIIDDWRAPASARRNQASGFQMGKGRHAEGNGVTHVSERAMDIGKESRSLGDGSNTGKFEVAIVFGKKMRKHKRFAELYSETVCDGVMGRCGNPLASDNSEIHSLLQGRFTVYGTHSDSEEKRGNNTNMVSRVCS